MVCPNLNKGTCTVNQRLCGQNYQIKMIKYFVCPTFKKNGVVKKPKVKPVTKKKSHKKIVAHKKKGLKKKVKTVIRKKVKTKSKKVTKKKK